MRIGMAVMIVLVGGVVAGCGQPGGTGQAPPSTRTVTAPAAQPPPPVHPARTAACPYLRKESAQDVNGQHVGQVRISADKPAPACFFYRPNGGLQLTVRPYKGDSGTAHALVDQAAPVRTSARATDPAGWSGGSQPTDSGAVYAVAKGDAAVVVTTNQRQTIKAKEAAEQAIAALGW
nr:DUF2020 domain-containing protein [Sciscionella sp. SE31]